MDKADRIYKELVHEEAAIWYVSDEYGSKIMIKAPTTGIKAMLKGCKIELLFGRNKDHTPNIFHTGLKIHDDLFNYQMMFCTHRFLDEHLSTAKIMNLDKVQVQLCNELSVCQAFGDLIIREKDKQEILSLLGNPKKLYVGEFTKQVEESLDSFQNSFKISSQEILQPLNLVTIEARIINCQSMKNYFYPGDEAPVGINIEGNEGDELEKEVFTVLHSLFNNCTFKNPVIPYKGGTRELTDILAFYELGAFLFETKALSVINAEDNRTMERKVAGLQKQILKAINQLVGAIKRISENTPIYDANGNEVLFNKTIVPHGVVLVSEFLMFGEWDKIVAAILNAMNDSKSMIHVMDMREFMQFVAHAKGDKQLFDYFLMQRIKYFVESRNLFQKSIFVDGGIESET